MMAPNEEAKNPVVTNLRLVEKRAWIMELSPATANFAMEKDQLNVSCVFGGGDSLGEWNRFNLDNNSGTWTAPNGASAQALTLYVDGTASTEAQVNDRKLDAFRLAYPPTTVTEHTEWCEALESLGDEYRALDKAESCLEKVRNGELQASRQELRNLQYLRDRLKAELSAPLPFYRSKEKGNPG